MGKSKRNRLPVIFALAFAILMSACGQQAADTGATAAQTTVAATEQTAAVTTEAATAQAASETTATVEQTTAATTGATTEQTTASTTAKPTTGTTAKATTPAAAAATTAPMTARATEKAQPVTLTISAAASLKDVMEEIKTVYAAEEPNVNIVYNFGSSGSLQQQIEQGADVDIFISAATKQMDALKGKGLTIDDTIRNFLKNEIVLVVPESSDIKDFRDLASDKVKYVGLGDLKSVPAGQYAEEVLTNLGIMDTVKPKAVYGKDVREVLTWVETGNADAGLVYKTDALISDKVKIAAEAPEGSHQPVYYPAGVIKAGKNPGAAKEFVNYIYGGKAKPIFEKYGFIFIAN